MTVEFSVLGPLELRVRGDVVALGPPKQRSMLAVLLRDANSVVPVTRIVGELWPAVPPTSAVANVRTYATGLRALLPRSGDGPSRLTAERGGYRLLVVPGELDSEEFERAAGAGQRALGFANYQEAYDQLCPAVGRWRGPALADVREGPLVDAWGRQLDQLYLGAWEDGALAELSLLPGHTLVGRLRAFVTQHPLREAAWRHLMLAQYRLGDIAGALDAFRDARTVLAEELGIDPGQALQDLHRLILERSPALNITPAPAAPVVVAPPAPRMLPRAPLHFFGREAELARLSALINPADDERVDESVLMAIHGLGGTGKSSLAISVAHAMSYAFPDGQLYIDLLGATVGLVPLEPAEILAQALRALGLTHAQLPRTTTERSSLLRSLLASRRVLLVLDNAHDAAQVRPALAATGPSAVIVTSRQMLSTLDNTTHIALAELPWDAAAEMLHHYAGPPTPDADAVEQIVRVCAGLPLALRIVGAQIADGTLRDLRAVAVALTDERRRLDALRHDDLAVRSAFESSYHELTIGTRAEDALAARAFRVFGMLPAATLALPVLAAALELTPATAAPAVQRLINLALVAEVTEHRYSVHDLVRLFASERAESTDPAPLRRQAVYRAAARYLDGLHLAKALAAPSRHAPDSTPQTGSWPGLTSGADAVRWFDDELPNVVAAVGWCAADDEYGQLALAMTKAAYPMLPMRRRWSEWEAMCEHTRAWAVRVGDLAAELTTITSLAASHCLSANRADDPRLPPAIEALDRAARIYRRLDDPVRESHARDLLGSAHVRAGRPGEATAHFAQGIALRRTIGDEIGEAIMLSNGAEALMLLDRPEECLAYLDRSLRLRRKHGDRIGEGTTLCNLGEVYLGRGRLQEALDVLDLSLKICRDVGNESTEPVALLNRAATYAAMGRLDEAAADAAQGLDLLRSHGDNGTATRALNELAQRLRDGGASESTVDSFLALGRPDHGRFVTS